MIENVKKSWSVVTVKVAVCAAAAALISLFLHWFTYKDEGMSLIEIVRESPEYFKGVLPLFLLGIVWVAVFFLLNHPKLTLLGDVLLLFMYAAMALEGANHGLSMGVGNILFLIAVIACVVCAFLTRKRKKNGKKSGKQSKQEEPER